MADRGPFNVVFQDCRWRISYKNGRDCGYARVCHRQKDHWDYPRHADDKTRGRATDLADILSGRKDIIVGRV